MEYNEFLQSKKIKDVDTGLSNVEELVLNDKLKPFQRDIVKWALRRGRACIFADCGMGKTFMQLEWAKHVPGDVLIVVPLAVSEQTIREADKFGIGAVVYSSDGTKKGKFTITNYERLEKFNPKDYTGIVLDESSILKSYTGAFKKLIISTFSCVPFRLACTATPAPNDFMELGNHSEFVGAMTRTEMLSMFFIHDGGETQKWRLKGHAQSEFWKWVCSWAVMIQKPSDLGYSDEGYSLPQLSINQVTVKVNVIQRGFLCPMQAQTLLERGRARKESLDARVAKAAELVAQKPNEQWIIWCDLNEESDKLTKSIPGAVEVKGSDKEEHKVKSLLGFANGDIRVLVSKPSIAGWGMNFQSCHNEVFVGLSDSYEQFYQAVRRCWRYGQNEPVNVFVIASDREGAVVRNIQRKEADAKIMAEEMVKNMKDINSQELRGIKRTTSAYEEGKFEGKNFTMYHGDCVDVLRKLPDNSVGYTLFSPPFASLYTYSNSDRDMGNSKSDEEFMEHFGYCVKELYRVLQSGRLVSFHCMNIPTSKERDGYIGIKDFRGDLIRLFEKYGFIYHSEVVIWKDPVVAMQRTKALGLLHKQLCKDSAMSRQGIPDYLVTMRKPGENDKPISGPLTDYVGKDKFQTDKKFSIDVWQRYASPVWMDINPSDTLQFRTARENEDERHICPLQLQVIERALQLWSAEGDVVLSPFAGIGSEGFVALERGRKFIGVELKKSYFDLAVKNLQLATNKNGTRTLFSSK